MTAKAFVPKIVFWGKRAGGFFDPAKPKGASYQWGKVVNIPRGSDTAGTSNQGPVGRRKTRWYAAKFGQKSKIKKG